MSFNTNKFVFLSRIVVHHLLVLHDTNCANHCGYDLFEKDTCSMNWILQYEEGVVGESKESSEQKNQKEANLYTEVSRFIFHLT